MQELLDYMKVNDKECYMTTTEHPFTDFFSAHEARITTHYHEHNVMSAIFSTIHEYGHAQYGLQVKEAYEGTSLFSEIGTAMHESQSRFMETISAETALLGSELSKAAEAFSKTAGGGIAG